VWYHNKEVKLDGYRFIACRFDGCKLVLTSTNFELDACYIDPTTTVVYGNDVLRPIKLFNSRNEWMYAEAPYFAPIRNANGTITIKG